MDRFREVNHIRTQRMPDHQMFFSIFTIGNVSPFASGSSTRSTSTYP